MQLGAMMLAAPFYRALTRPARAAQPPAQPSRFIVFFSPNGTIHSHWRPQGETTAFTFAAGSILEPLSAYRNDLVILDELNFYGVSNHDGGMGSMLTNGSGAETLGASIDQVIAKKIAGDTKFPSIELGVQTSSWGGGVSTRMSYSGAGQFVTPDDDPRNTFNRLFGDMVGGAEALARLRRRRKSILDNVSGELSQLHSRLGVDERVKMEAHLTSLRSLEKALETDPSASCTVPTQPDRLAMYQNDNFPKQAKYQIDLAVRALACGLTRVTSIQLSHTVGDRVYSWIGVADGHHSLSHADDSNTSKVADFVKAERWNAEQFAYLLGQLKATPDPDGGGSLLDTSIVLWAKEMGDGRMHTCESVPWVLAGKGNGTLQTGRYLKLGGQNHAKVLVSLCQRYGLTNQTFGTAEAGTGPLGVL
jgi:hypothetical protein